MNAHLKPDGYIIRPVVWQHTDKAPGEVATLMQMAQRCVLLALIIIWRRVSWRAVDFGRYLVNSLQIAWLTAAAGWGFGITSAALLIFMR